jgi:hypothetical protein
MVDTLSGSRGERAGAGRFTALLAIAAVLLVGAAIGVVAALLPHRSERPISTHVRAVSVWNALEHRCQLENDVGAPPLPFTCGAHVLTDVHRSADATSAPLLFVRSPHDNCVIDETTLAPLLCRDTFFEWAAVRQEVVSVGVIDPRGTHYVVAQRDLAIGQLHTIEVPLTSWFERSDPAEIFVFDGERRARIGLGALEPIEE